MDEPHGVVLASATASATVALGIFGTLAEEFSRGKTDVLDGAHAAILDHIVAFGHAIQAASAAEAAWRVVVWALVVEQATFYWRPNYDLEIDIVRSIFGAHTIFEETVMEHGRPVAHGATEDEIEDRRHRWMEAALYCAVSAATNHAVEPPDPFVEMHMIRWAEALGEGLTTVTARTNQLAPGGLPIWDG